MCEGGGTFFLKNDEILPYSWFICSGKNVTQNLSFTKETSFESLQTVECGICGESVKDKECTQELYSWFICSGEKVTQNIEIVPNKNRDTLKLYQTKIVTL